MLFRSGDKDDDMEQFLNDCDGEDDDETDEDNDETYDDDTALNVNVTQDDIFDNDVSYHNASDEIQALREFRKYLLQLMDAYTLPKNTDFDWTNFIPSEELSDRCHTIEQSRQMYAANLIYSEMRILQFYIWVTERLQYQLLLKQDPNDDTVQSTSSKPMLRLASDDEQLLNRQIEELASAYMKLRHGKEIDKHTM